MNEKKIKQAMFQFIFPFSIKQGVQSNLLHELKQQKFERFKLDHLDTESSYYGDYSVSHREIEQYYLPFTNKILFPQSEKEKGFQRFSKKIDLHCMLDAQFKDIPFHIHSLDITISPYQLGFLTIRTEISENVDLSLALEFASRFRILDPYFSKGTKIVIKESDKEYKHVEDFIFEYLCKGLTNFFNRQNMEGAYFESLPFFEDEKMYVHSLVRFEEETSIDNLDSYRAALLDGLNAEGLPSISSNNHYFIEKYLEKNLYDRWTPNTHYVLGENCFCCITNEKDALFSQLASQFYGQYYYGFLLNLFHKIVLLKLANDYSEINVEQDNEKIEKLIHSINTFTSNYFFLELAAQSQGRQIFVHLRKMFLIEDLYRDARQTLFSLYKYEEKFSNQKNNFLLLILTLYTVVGGIYGMNQVIEDLKGNIDWSKILGYSLFEYIALFITFSGLVTAASLGIYNFFKWRVDKKKRERWSEESSISSKE